MDQEALRTLRDLFGGGRSAPKKQKNKNCLSFLYFKCSIAAGGQWLLFWTKQVCITHFLKITISLFLIFRHKQLSLHQGRQRRWKEKIKCMGLGLPFGALIKVLDLNNLIIIFFFLQENRTEKYFNVQLDLITKFMLCVRYVELIELVTRLGRLYFPKKVG